tara:strand:+ start:465 stop:1154 length:690 start_codon:yes stop_codon:yes gene_type:complete
MRDVRKNWREYQPNKIPTKEGVPDYLYTILAGKKVKRILDLGCGTGKLAFDLAKRGYSVTGVDINEEAIKIANLSLKSCNHRIHLKFLVGDATGLKLDEGPFDAILLQLLISIIGTYEDRIKLIQQVGSWLNPNGILYLSASAVSDEINPKYAELYRKGSTLTGEEYSSFSEDSETGKVLYMTHHFSKGELGNLLRENFHIDLFNKEKEVSSRRPTEQAYFFYVIARRS